MRFDFTGVDTTLGPTSMIVIGTEPEGLAITRAQATMLVFNLVEALPFDSVRIETTKNWEKSKRIKGKSGKYSVVRSDLGPDLSSYPDYFRRHGVDSTGIKPLYAVDGDEWGEGCEITVPAVIRQSNGFHWMVQAMTAKCEEPKAS